jgi:MOSC domain-containing protein YiiM
MEKEMQLISINLGQVGTIQKNGSPVRTGIFKNPTDQPVRVNKTGIEHDVVVDTKHHGGPDQAVYIYGDADYMWWRKESGRNIPAGTFGENLTISELESARFNIGDLLHVGKVVLQVTSPRIPCKVFAARMNDLQWVKKFRDAQRPGLYCRVIQEGVINTGDPVSVEPYQGDTLSILEMYKAYYQKEKTEAVYRIHLNAPIDIRTRKVMEEGLHKLLNTMSADKGLG